MLEMIALVEELLGAESMISIREPMQSIKFLKMNYGLLFLLWATHMKMKVKTIDNFGSKMKNKCIEDQEL